MSKTMLLQTIQYSKSTVFCLHTVKCKNGSIWNNSVYPKDTIYLFLTQTLFNSTLIKCYHFLTQLLSSATTSGQCGPGNNGNKGVLCIRQGYSNTDVSPRNCTISYPGQLFWDSFPSAGMNSVYFTVPANWSTRKRKTLISKLLNFT